MKQHKYADKTPAVSPLLRARKLVLYLLIAIATCTLITAVLLVLHTLDMPSSTVVRSINGGTASSSTGARPRSSQDATDNGTAKPLSKELDPDFVDSKAQIAKSSKKACPPGCEIRGNCNAEEGRCECPFGYHGPACDKEIFPACKLTAKSTEMHCGDRMPRSCECLRQCRAFFCPNKGRCETPRESWYVQCFERIAKNMSDLARAHGGKVGPGVTVKGPRDPFLRGAVYSDVPEEWEEQKGLVEWFQSLRDDLPRKRLKQKNATFVSALYPGDTDLIALPLSQCPGGCLGRGQCIKSWTGRPKCLCWQGYTGNNCEQVHKPSCVNMCMNRGICRGGFCHCQPGWWGKDCSRSKAFAPHNAHSSVTALKIYAYELPTHLAFDMERFVGFQGHDPGYIAYKGFISGFMNDWTVRTENPWEANLFFVPALSYAYSSNLGDVTVHLQRVMMWVRDQQPFFNRTAGKDHFVWLPNDRGSCWIDPSDPLLGNLIKISHFGFHQTDTKLSEFKLVPQHGAACHMPERDVVAAPYSWQQELIANETYKTYDAQKIPNGTLLFFAGSIRENESEYSGGVRQALWKLYKEGKLGPNVTISDRNNLTNFKDLVRSSKYCFAPWGHGWGNRLGLFMVMGCVPVIVQDGVYQPYQDLLPYHEFSVRLPKSRLPHITEILTAIPDEEYVKLRQGVAKYWPAFVWHPKWGGQAYKYVIRSLAARANNHLAQLY